MKNYIKDVRLKWTTADDLGEILGKRAPTELSTRVLTFDAAGHAFSARLMRKGTHCARGGFQARQGYRVELTTPDGDMVTLGSMGGGLSGAKDALKGAVVAYLNRKDDR